MYLRPAAAVIALLAAMAGCASLTESTEQSVLVQTVLDHREIAGVGCVLYNDVGKWFVTTPGRVTLRKSAGPLRIDCQKADKGWAYEKVESKVGRQPVGESGADGGCRLHRRQEYRRGL